MFRTPSSTVPFVAALLTSLAAPGTAQDLPVVVFETTVGTFAVELDTASAPGTTANFLRLVRKGFYDDIVVHRILRGTVVQMGTLDGDGNLRGMDEPAIQNEADNRLHHGRGTVAMARADTPHSATTQFFINVRDNWDYNFQNYTKGGYGYAVFGRVIEGMDVIEGIADLDTRRLGPFRDVPATMVLVYRAYERESGP